MDINQELSNIQKEINIRYNLFKAMQGKQRYINKESDFKSIEHRIDKVKPLCLSEKRKDTYKKFCEVLELYVTTKNKIEKFNKQNEKDKADTSHTKKPETEYKGEERFYECKDGSKISIEKMNKEYDPIAYNFTNLPPAINRYRIKRKVNKNLHGEVEINNEIFCDEIDLERIEKNDNYRNKILNALLSKKNINDALESYGGNAEDAYKNKRNSDNYNVVDEYTTILARKQMEKSHNFVRNDKSRICILPVGNIQIKEGNKQINQYRYSSFEGQYKSVHTGFLYGNIDITRMQDDETYRNIILKELKHKWLGNSEYIGDFNEEHMKLEQDQQVVEILDKLRFVQADRDIQEILNY